MRRRCMSRAVRVVGVERCVRGRGSGRWEERPPRRVGIGADAVRRRQRAGS